VSATLRAAPPISTTTEAERLWDLSPFRWKIVAVRMRAGIYDHWNYTMPRPDVDEFSAMVADGRALSTHGVSDGRKVLFGKLARV
jgi:hypothetical protein